MAGIVIKKIVREHVGVEPFKDGESFGHHIDRMLDTALKEGAEVQSIGLEIDELEWSKMVRDYHDPDKDGATPTRRSKVAGQ